MGTFVKKINLKNVAIFCNMLTKKIRNVEKRICNILKNDEIFLII
jgi:hypothetical protein